MKELKEKKRRASFRSYDHTYRQMLEERIKNGKATEAELSWAENGYKTHIRNYQKKLKPIDETLDKLDN